MTDKIISLLTLACIRGYRTFGCCAVIIVLAIAHQRLGVEVPGDVWIALLAILVACLRAGMPPTATAMCLCVLLCGGCFGTTTVYMLSSRAVTAYGSNAVTQATEGGANLASNTLTATLPLR